VETGDSLSKVYRKIIADFESENTITFTAKEKRIFENYLVLNQPQVKLKKGDIVTISETELVAALENIEKA
jgi:ribosomal protein S17